MHGRIYRALIGAAIHAATWIATVIVVSALSSGMSSSAAYGILSGWWAALYVGRLASIGIEAAIPLALGYAVLGMVSVPLGWSWIYHDPPISLSSAYVGTVLVAGLLFASPTAVNWLVGVSERWLVTLARR